jgi:hypothetical protein
LAISWLQNCNVFHGICSANHEKEFKPSRLLFLEKHSIRLHTALDMPKRVKYLTLSHCWGRHQLIRLLESNFEAFREDIPYQLLSQTFRDAIRVTRKLGFSYLWIDSLCIIQDSRDDWNHEARLMGKIYTHATCNIAASDAPDSTHGCLYPRTARAIQPDAIDFGPDEGEQHLLNRTDIYEHQHILYTRAWVLQEAILARRTLDCGRGQLFWRCGEMRASEVWPGGVPTNIYHDDHPASKFKAISAEGDQIIMTANIISQRLGTHTTRSQIPRAPGKGSVERYTDAPFAFWAAIVSDYTSMNLTKDEDRPIAIAGITDVFRPFFGSHHFGMWRIFMPLELLWSVSGIRKRPSTVRAPSWSWLATESHVSYALCDFKYGRDVLLTRFIEIDDMRLRVETRLLRAKWTGSGYSTSISSIEGETRWLRWRGVPTIPEDYGSIHFDQPEDVPDADVDIFLMCIQIHKQYEKRSLGLVLREKEAGAYERLGYFTDYQMRILPFLKRAERREIVLV